MNEKKQICWGIILSYVHMAVGMVVTLLYTPFVIRVLGQSDYGLYNTVSSVVASLSILNLGFGSSYVRFFSRYKAQNKQDEIARLNGMFMLVFLLIGLVALLCGAYLSENLYLIFANGLTADEMVVARVLMWLLTVNLAVSFPASVFTSIITAHQQFVFQKMVLILKQLISPMISIPVLLMGYGSIGIVVSMVMVCFAIDAVNVWFCLRKLKIRFSFVGLEKSVFKEISVFSGFIAINMIVDQINLNVDKMLLGRYCGTESVAVYSAGFVLYHYYSTFSTSISNVYAPLIHKIWNNSCENEPNRNIQLTNVFVRVGRIQFTILLLLLSGIFLFGRQFIRIWAGNGYENAYYVVMMLGISALIPLSQNIGIEIQRAKNMHRFRSLAYLVMAAVNLVLSIVLCQRYGEIGSALGTAISFLLANTLAMNLYYRFAMGIHVEEYWRQIAKCFVAAIPAGILGIQIHYLLDTWSLQGLLLGICIYLLGYCTCEFMLGCSVNERRELMKKLKKKVHLRQ